MDNQQYETYELILKDDEDEVFALSLVNSPAIQSNFVYFSEDGIKEVIKFATTDEEQKTIVGPILIPDMKILRMKEDGKTPYYVTFSKDTVKKIAQKYIRDNNANNITIDYITGYTTLPEALKTALLNQVYYLYDNRSVGVDDISPIAKIILNLYKRV